MNQFSFSLSLSLSLSVCEEAILSETLNFRCLYFEKNSTRTSSWIKNHAAYILKSESLYKTNCYSYPKFQTIYWQNNIVLVVL
jgi:hypothetical protein